MNQQTSPPATDPTARNIRLTVIGLLIFIGIVVAGFVNKVSQPRVMTDSELKINGAYMFETPRALPPFELTDHHGQPFDKQRLEGKWTLVFFGFTHCPDICPTTMSLLSQFMEKLDGLPEQEDTQVVLVTVDPARDDVEQLALYVPYFNPEFIGVTGEFLEIHRFATALNTPFRKVPGQGENYQVDHSANVVLINPRGDYHGFFKAPLDLAKLKVTYRSTRVVWDY
jgi:protein SCO1/2